MSHPSTSDSDNPYQPPAIAEQTGVVYGLKMGLAVVSALVLWLALGRNVPYGYAIGAYLFGAFVGVLVGNTQSEKNALGVSFFFSWVIGSIVALIQFSPELQKGMADNSGAPNWFLSLVIGLLFSSLMFAAFGTFAVASAIHLYMNLLFGMRGSSVANDQVDPSAHERSE